MGARQNVWRVLHLLTVGCRHLTLALVGGLLRRWPGLLAKAPPFDLTGPERLRHAIEELGGTFIKFGQMLALQPDILPLRYCRVLADLLDRIQPFGFEWVDRTFAEDLGVSPDEIFDTFEREPLSTASIGQVHLATLGGRKLAVKVRRPAVEKEFGGDIRLMTASVRIIRGLRLKPLYWMIEPISEFVAWTREELDYRHEARYMERQRRNSRDNRCERVPAVLWDFTTSRILVAEFFEGVTVLEVLRALESDSHHFLHRLRSKGYDPETFARNIIDNFLGDAFQYGLFHADLHPANLLVLPDNVVGYVDFGITGVLSPYSRQHLIEMTLAYTRADLEGMAQAFLLVTEWDETSDIDGFREGLRTHAEGWYELDGRKQRLKKNFTLVMLDMLRLSHKTNIWPERDVIKYIRSSIAIDGLITRFAPGFIVGDHLAAVCERYLRAQYRAELYSPDTLASMARAGGNILRDGALRLSRFVQQVTRGELPIGFGETTAETDAVQRSRATYLSATALGAAILIAATTRAPVIGVNLFTAEVMLLVAATVLLIRTVRRLA